MPTIPAGTASSRVVSVQPFAERFCAANGCPASEFRHAVFWRTLYPRARPLARLLFASEYFAADFDLIDACAQARSLRDIDIELERHLSHPRNRGLLRRRFKLRVSGARLKRIAREYLAGAATS